MGPGWRLLLVCACAALPAMAAAEENSDLDLIPDAIQAAPVIEQPKGGASEPAGRLFVEDAFTRPWYRSDLPVPPPPSSNPNLQNRTSLDAALQWDLADSLSASLSNRFNLVEQDNIAMPGHQMLRNDFREGFLTWEPLTRSYVEAGRINVRNGVALGFNPTDFFKSRTLVDQASLDPSVIRQDRLGTAMLRGQRIWDSGAASFVFAPELSSPTPIAITTPAGIRPRFDRTNGTDRTLFILSTEIADLSPQVLVYHEADRTKFGANLSRPIGQSVIAYAEWAGGNQPTVIADALAYGRRTGTLPANAFDPLPGTNALAFRNDLAVGASWTSSAKVTINAEYHYHQAGLSGADWRNWFATGTAARGNPLVTGELWYIRAFASDQQEPLTRQQVFLRADWTDALISHLELSAFAFVNLYDGSTLAQIAATYDISDHWSFGAYVAADLGSPRSERGSLAQAGSAIVQVVRYF